MFKGVTGFVGLFSLFNFPHQSFFYGHSRSVLIILIITLWVGFFIFNSYYHHHYHHYYNCYLYYLQILLLS